jgi:hypothetical protein
MAQQLGSILTLTGVLVLIVMFVRGPNLGLPRWVGYAAGVGLLVLGLLVTGVALLSAL